MTKAERQNLQSLWATRVTEFRGSGMSAPNWSKANDISIHQLRYWLKKDKRAAVEGQSLSWMSVDLSHAGISDSLLVRVGMVTVEVRPGFNPKLLVDVVNTLTML